MESQSIGLDVKDRSFILTKNSRRIVEWTAVQEKYSCAAVTLYKVYKKKYKNLSKRQLPSAN